MKMEKLTKQVALLIAVVTGMGIAQAAHDETKKGIGQVATHHEATHHIVSGQTKAPAFSRVSAHPTIAEKKPRDYLHRAVQMGNKDLAKKLIAKGKDVNEKDSTGQTPLHLAARKSSMRFYRPSEKHQKDHLELIKFLLEEGADVDATDRVNETPLQKAVDKDVILLLLDEGANIDAKNLHGQTALDKAFGRGDIEVINILLDKGAALDAGADKK